jgi:hypothetical protein
MRRTSIDALQEPDDAQDLAYVVVDKRSQKRATTAKGRRRNRRYENRLLNAQVRSWEEEANDSLEPED